jgi:hypothetical protein
MTEDDQIDWTTDPVRKARERVEAFEDKHGFRAPDTYWKDIGHEVFLNPDAKVAPKIPAERKARMLEIWSGRRFDLAVFVPRESGTIIHTQTDGKRMKTVEMEGTFIPLDPPADPRLPDAWETPDDYDPREPWEEIESWYPFEFEDVPAPDGLAQTQESIRWIQVTEIHEEAYVAGFVVSEDCESVEHVDRYDYRPPWHWLDVATEKQVALFYQNCD